MTKVLLAVALAAALPASAFAQAVPAGPATSLPGPLAGIAPVGATATGLIPVLAAPVFASAVVVAAATNVGETAAAVNTK